MESSCKEPGFLTDSFGYLEFFMVYDSIFLKQFYSIIYIHLGNIFSLRQFALLLNEYGRMFMSMILRYFLGWGSNYITLVFKYGTFSTWCWKLIWEYRIRIKFDTFYCLMIPIHWETSMNDVRFGVGRYYCPSWTPYSKIGSL